MDENSEREGHGSSEDQAFSEEVSNPSSAPQLYLEEAVLFSEVEKVAGSIVYDESVTPRILEDQFSANVDDDRPTKEPEVENEH